MSNSSQQVGQHNFETEIMFPWTTYKYDNQNISHEKNKAPTSSTSDGGLPTSCL
jgi:hypothetical protein